MKRLIFSLILIGLSLTESIAQTKIPETINLLPGATRRTEIILPQVNGLNIYKADLHIHSIYSDATLTPAQRVDEAWADGLDIVAMTDHIEYRKHEGTMLEFLKGYTDGKAKKAINSKVIRQPATEEGILADLNIPTQLTQKAAKKYGGALLVIPGCEVTREPITIGHYNALFTTDNNAIYDVDALQSLRNAKKQGALITHNHPGWRRKTTDLTEFEQKAYAEGLIDGIEVMNGVSFYPKVIRRCVENNLYMLGCTDVHALTSVYKANDVLRTMTLIFAEENSLDAIRKALEGGMTLGYCAGNIAGRLELLEALFRASVDCKFLARGSKGAALYALTNNSSIGYKIRQGKRVISLPPFQTTTISVGKTKEGADRPLAFYVANMWEMDYKNPKIVYDLKAE